MHAEQVNIGIMESEQDHNLYIKPTCELDRTDYTEDVLHLIRVTNQHRNETVL